MNDFSHIYKSSIKILNRKLPEYIVYHSVEHTKLVLENVKLICHHEGVNDNDLFILKIAALYHDMGYIINNINHEELSCNIASNNLQKYGFDQQAVKQICDIIMATKVPQKPSGKLAAILADADLLYLGTNDFLRLSNKLYQEILHYQPDLSVDKWNEIQYDFISKHRFHTKFCKDNFEEKKNNNLRNLQESMVSNHFNSALKIA